MAIVRMIHTVEMDKLMEMKSVMMENITDIRGTVTSPVRERLHIVEMEILIQEKYVTIVEIMDNLDIAILSVAALV
jgi:hypothetical protein